MLLKKLICNVLNLKIAKCQELSLEDQMEDKISIEEEEQLEEQKNYIPSFMYLSQHVRTITMSNPGMEINGFRFAIGIPLSQNFLTSHTINLTPTKSHVLTGNQNMDIFSERSPYYTLLLQYHHGVLTPTHQNIAFSLFGKIDTAGGLEALFMKKINNWKLKTQSYFPNSNIEHAQSNCEIEHFSENSKQTMTLSNNTINYNIVERFGKKIFLGFDLNYFLSRNVLSNSFALRFKQNPDTKYFLQFDGCSNSLKVGSLFRLNESNSLATELEFGGPMNSQATFGFRGKSKLCEVISVAKTNGEIKSTFAYTQERMYKLKLFLGGNLLKEDFKSGFSFSIGETEE